MNTGKSSDNYTKAAVDVICTSSAGSILGANDKGRVMQFRWEDEAEELKFIRSVETNITGVMYMCYVEQNDAVVLSCEYPG